ncbi:dihydroorotate dehydrogenase electron transfer subunit [Dissulfurispira sp.]|uniref:dihydroorotate dehydrogenase electron transfer subunit n=1 Tax=Dissulfurispira sp. TaxID=2817609 RepID=UPI002FDA4BC6
MSKYFKAKTVDNISLNKHFRLLNLSPLSDIDIPQPGQFYMLQAGDTYDPLLKRPFSIFRHEDNSLSFLYRIRGKGTLSLSHLKSGDIINAIGPLGNSYPEPHGDFIALAGGIGIASLLHLLAGFKNKAYLFYGARNKEELVMLNEAKAISKESFITTDDGSEGEKGLITDSLMKFFNSLPITHYPLPLYACGPTPMLRELSKVVAGKDIKCYVSLEEHMACGVGACLGCVIKTVSGYKRVCKEGPVFDIKYIIWE